MDECECAGWRKAPAVEVSPAEANADLIITAVCGVALVIMLCTRRGRAKVGEWLRFWRSGE
jgi:hypothetical protein